MEPAEAPSLMLQAEKALQQPIKPHLFSHCPTMDLVAVVGQDDNLDVYRLNGQRAFGLKRRMGSAVESICWKFNGQHLAVAWDDGTIDIVSSETGKTVKQVHREASLAPSEDEIMAPKVSCLGWGVNFIDVDSVKGRTSSTRVTRNGSVALSDDVFDTTDEWAERQDEVTLDDFLERQPDLQKLGIATDLPDQIALIDVQDVLPKFPVIPAPPATPMQMMSKSSSSDAFSSQQSIDAIFHSQHLRDHNSVDVLLVGSEDGSLSPTLYDSLEIGGMRLPGNWSLSNTRPLLTASHPYSCSHLSLMEVKDEQSQNVRLALIPLTLRFIPTTGIYLHLIASKTAQLQSLLMYLRASLRTIIAYFHHARDLPSRFMMSIDETLASKGEPNLVQSLYHLATTGHCPKTIKEWLTDELTENGHKRWDHAATQGYTKVLEMTHENLLPALDRCSIVVSMLRGLASYTGSSSIINVAPQDLTEILDTVRSLRLLGHNILVYAGEERRQFVEFSKWLRHEIDTQAAEPAPQATEETEKDAGVDFGQLFAYIQRTLKESRLTPFLRRQQDLGDFRLGVLEYEIVKNNLKRHKMGLHIEQGSLCTSSVTQLLQTQCDKLFAQITAWQAANCSLSCGLFLEAEKPSETSDMRMVYERQEESSNMTTYVAIVPSEAKNQVRIHRIVHADRFEDVESDVRSMQANTVEFSGATIQDVKFADDSSLILLLRHDSASYLLFLPYSIYSREFAPTAQFTTTTFAPETGAHAMPSGSAIPLEKRDSWRLEAVGADDWRGYVKHVFPAGDHFVPLRLEVNGRKDRRIICILGEDLRHYKIFDLDYGAQRDGDGDGDTTIDTIMSG
ncbi:anaphase-promoting complex, cyclosome, subunit 4-domain-containing protein [Phyllosticta capitalensis]|uniref:Anaphase-promoting complex subunit 4 n=1 Tax=Phyllosticta capitalensis TaxID=121624 RepID=A0ABR1YMR9_9PEZI